MFTYDQILEAYIKLKTYIYYDSTNLYMRKQLAVFETNLDDTDVFSRLSEYAHFERKYKVDFHDEEELTIYERKLKVFTEAINKFDTQPEYFDHFLGQVKPRFLPKKIFNKHKDSKIITNKRTAEEYLVERTTVFIDAPVEIHLLSILWILEEGVNLDRELCDGCFGNRLILNKEKTKVVQGSGLFKPYPKQYQKWRDDAVNTAKEHLEGGKDVLILNLDIKDFFYSVRIPREKFYKHRNSKHFAHLNNLFSLFENIHHHFTATLLNEKTPYDFSKEVTAGNDITHYILPIGLLSSFVLANYYLKDFDDRIIKVSRPIFYGRYVDDILMVISDPVLPHEHINDTISELNFDYKDYVVWASETNSHDEHENVSELDYEELSDLEQFVLRNFYPIITLIDRPSFLNPHISNHQERVFKLNGFKRLYCQGDKTLLYYFDKDESSMVIDKLKRDLEEKSSEFRNYSDEEEVDDFEDSAYHLLYDGTDGKIRTLKDYKEDKFGLSVYLSKKIFNTLRSSDKISDAEAEKIVRYFQGCNTLNLYTLWERLFTYLLVNNKPGAYVHFYLNCCEAIKRLKPVSSDNRKRDFYQNDLLEYLDCANELALALHPKFLTQVKKINRTYNFSFNALKEDLELFRARYTPTDENSYFISRFRRSNLVRHQFVAQPLLSYSKSAQKDYRNFTDLKISF